MNLRGKTIGIIAGPGFDDEQVVKTAQILRQRDARVVVIGTGDSEAVAIAGRQGSLLKPDIVLGAVNSKLLDAVIVPGGDSISRLAGDERVLTLLLEINTKNKPIGATCGGAVVLGAAGLVSGKRVTGDNDSRADLENAGAIFLNQSIVVDRCLVTARSEDDIPHFVEAISFLLEPAATLS